MKSAEEIAKQIDAMTMTHDLHWQNIKPLIEARDAEHAAAEQWVRDERDELYTALIQAIHVTGIHTTGDGWIHDWMGSRIYHKDDKAELYAWLERQRQTEQSHANNPQ